MDASLMSDWLFNRRKRTFVGGNLMIFLVNLADVCNTFLSVKCMKLLTLISILCTSFSAVGDQPGLKLIGALFCSVLWHLRPCHSYHCGIQQPRLCNTVQFYIKTIDYNGTVGLRPAVAAHCVNLFLFSFIKGNFKIHVWFVYITVTNKLLWILELTLAS